MLPSVKISKSPPWNTCVKVQTLYGWTPSTARIRGEGGSRRFILLNFRVFDY